MDYRPPPGGPSEVEPGPRSEKEDALHRDAATGQRSNPGYGSDRLARIAGLCRQDMLAALSNSRWLARMPRRLLQRLVERRIAGFAGQLIEFDDRIARDGLASASAWGLTQWSGPVQQYGHPAPPGGPLLLVSNHPGLVDAITLLSTLADHDVRLLVAERPLFHALPALQAHLISVAPAGAGRAQALRAAVRHLRSGGTLVTYPAGHIEPDPAADPGGARAALARWSPSATYLARRVPALTVQPVAVSHVIAAHYRRHWLARQAIDPEDRDAIAAALQVLAARVHDNQPRLALGTPITGVATNALQSEIKQKMTALMHENLSQ
ncbi:1-acyl-sn-glycerol-3-phosphate acyltransferase [Salinisphaera hydrothermalis]|uniref:Phospholipid/glycerol acyltransferase n=2 Tax=Salinisphaera TaxID=180541 RepID=A0A084IPV1_SALHC|nr:phospholipid/glycerol acyltransferase [Salinisphaera hydrothermalis C41B8]